VNGLHTEVLDSVICLFNSPLIQNNLRGLYVETLVSIVLGKNWNVVSTDWSAWDIEHEDGTRLEVKQSAAKQTWYVDGRSGAVGRFGIQAAKYVWENDARKEAAGRQASIYVFAWHGTLDETADHRDAGQWEFYVVAESELPNQRSIGLKSLRKLTHSVCADELLERVESIRIGENQ
jgi:hypothetical protein